jgi:hypothetical protein
MFLTLYSIVWAYAAAAGSAAAMRANGQLIEQQLLQNRQQKKLFLPVFD